MLLINAMGTHERMALALEVESLDDIAREITELFSWLMYPLLCWRR